MSPIRTLFACCKHCGDMACPGGLDDHWVPCIECQSGKQGWTGKDCANYCTASFPHPSCAATGRPCNLGWTGKDCANYCTASFPHPSCAATERPCASPIHQASFAIEAGPNVGTSDSQQSGRGSNKPSAPEVKPTPYGPDSAPGHREAAKRVLPPNERPSTTEGGARPRN